MSELGCDVVGIGRPQVWKDDYGWNCDQSTICRRCLAVSFDRLAEDVTWAEALAASTKARPVEEAAT